ncbi:tRNA1(Val) (adenine(37)-N6)-methyltransferase [Sinomicrobium weinanense]|uniref:tRNA1(Val) (adenine(37)-N6)-methyltransferase n=1 Tax=Sinomicrobium weinanense TaxID=2842200 RepID=A0A926JQE1_9FLAO|nr:methyltransferase [Sinomicrobium weinanense]MBC9795451.1 methyltransferase [Sinomicrobium weinanense]MBU3123976.1 methyltransferase [Sinomicrobium weinanense]
MSDKPFHFKKFTVNQDRCAMKVGTDGVLLGAWADVSGNPFSVLDIGAGTGLIALMLAQRSDAGVVDAVEIEDAAYEQCVGNFEDSPWNDRLFCYHASIVEFAGEIDDTYDLIVSNPPFYTENISTGDKQRDMARSAASLPFRELLECVSSLLSEEGSFNVIIPYREEEGFGKLAEQYRLFPYRITRVRGAEEGDGAEIKRSLLAFSFKQKETFVDELTIEKGRHQYTEKYVNLTRDFYLKM